MTFQPLAREFSGAATDHSLMWLLVVPHLSEYLSFVARKVVDGDRIPPARLVDEWRRANDHFYDLEQSEANEPDRIECAPLCRKLRTRARRLQADPWYCNTFDRLPTTIEMVELDRLVVWQLQVADHFATGHVASLGADPDPAALFDFCLPERRPSPPVEIRRLSAEHYQFISDATDLEAMTPQLLATSLASQLESTGPVAAAFAVPVGFGANFMSAIRSDNRVLLHNGYHRAYALRAAGITHAPCIIQTVTRRDELNLVADHRVSSDQAFFFRAPRPPMLRDFFDPLLAKQLHIRPIRTVVDVQIRLADFQAADYDQSSVGRGGDQL